MDRSSESEPLLIYHLTEEQCARAFQKVVIARTPLECLNEATLKRFALIVIRVSIRHISSRNEIFALCECLKTNPLTSRTPMLVSMDTVHRDIVYKIHRIGVRFMCIAPLSAAMDSSSMIKAIKRGDARILTDRILDDLCPFLHYTSIDDHSELITCGKYGNRMVLGGRRLHEVCESADHRYCEYLLNSETRHDVSQSHSQTASGPSRSDGLSAGHGRRNAPAQAAACQ